MPFLLTVWPLLIPIAVAIYLYWISWTRLVDPQQISITVQYEPPDNLSPGECGALLDNAVALRGVTATLVDLSVKGYLAIEVNDEKSPSRKDGEAYVFHLLKPPSEWTNLKPHESAILSGIFIATNPLQILSEAMSRVENARKNPILAAAFSGVRTMEAANPSLRALSEANGAPRPMVAVMEVQTNFNLHLPIIRDSVFEELVAGGYYNRRPDQVRLVYGAIGVVIGLLQIPLIFVMLGKGGLQTLTGVSWLAWILSGTLTSLIILGFGTWMPARSIAGARALKKVLGFADFLKRVEKDHIERLETTPQLFEKYLPYAMALGVEKTWAQSFARITVPTPQWYRGGGSDFFPVELVNGISSKIPTKQGA